MTSDPALAQDAIADSAEAPTGVEAALIVAKYNHPVTIESDSNETTLVEAMPEGGLRTRLSNAPERTKVGGHWRPIDTGLTASGEWLVPKVSAVGVRFGAGGSDVVAQVQSESGEWVTQSWPHGALPVPTIDGDTAVYADVFTDVDLRVTATAQGMREVLVVGNAAAAANPALAGTTFELSGASVEKAADTGTLVAVPANGAPLAAGTPVWWDSSAAGADSAGPGAGEQLAVPVTHTDDSVSLDVAGIAHDASVTYPLYVDPDWTPTMQKWWYIDRTYPNQTYLAASSMSVGYGIESGIGYLSRTFYQFDISTFKGATVSKAVFNVHQAWANSCDTTNLELWRTSPMGTPGFTWNQQPNNWSQRLDAAPSPRGCGTGANAPGIIGFTATAGVQQQLVEGQSLIQLGLRTANEASSLTRKHLDGIASLTVTYNRPPAVPTDTTMTSPVRDCRSATDPAVYVYNGPGGPLTMRARAADPDGDQVKVGFYIAKTSDLNALVKQTWSPAGLQASNTWQSYTVDPKGLADGSYAWKSRSADASGLTSAYSAWCYFTVDSTAPGLPTVTTTDTSPIIGQPMTVTVTSDSADPAVGFQVWWASGVVTSPGPQPASTDYVSGAPACGSTKMSTRIVCATNGSASFTVAPADRLTTLWVASYDRVGNVSAVLAPDNTTMVAAGRGLAVAAGADDAATGAGHLWSTFDTGLATVDDVRAGTLPLAVGTLTGWEDASVDEDAAMVFPGAQVPAPFANTATASPAVDTTKSFTVRARVKPASTKAGALASQAGTTNSGFELRSSGGKWQFCVTAQGASTKTGCVTSIEPIVVGSYSTVSGIWDQVAHQLRIAVYTGSGASTAQEFYDPPTDDKPASGATVVGAAQLNGAVADVFDGAIADVSIQQGVLSAQDLTSRFL